MRIWRLCYLCSAGDCLLARIVIVCLIVIFTFFFAPNLGEGRFWWRVYVYY